MTLFSQIAVVSVVVAMLACDSATAPPSSVTIGDNVVRLTASASARELFAGSPVTLRIALTNEGSDAVTLHFGDSCQLLPYIRNSAGSIVLPNGGWVCLTVLTQLTLAPGQSEVNDYIWTGSTSFRSEMPLRPLPPGRYYFTAESGQLRTPPIELILK